MNNQYCTECGCNPALQPIVNDGQSHIQICAWCWISYIDITNAYTVLEAVATCNNMGALLTFQESLLIER